MNNSLVCSLEKGTFKIQNCQGTKLLSEVNIILTVDPHHHHYPPSKQMYKEKLRFKYYESRLFQILPPPLTFGSDMTLPPIWVCHYLMRRAIAVGSASPRPVREFVHNSGQIKFSLAGFNWNFRFQSGSLFSAQRGGRPEKKLHF